MHVHRGRGWLPFAVLARDWGGVWISQEEDYRPDRPLPGRNLRCIFTSASALLRKFDSLRHPSNEIGFGFSKVQVYLLASRE